MQILPHTTLAFTALRLTLNNVAINSQKQKEKILDNFLTAIDDIPAGKMFTQSCTEALESTLKSLAVESDLTSEIVSGYSKRMQVTQPQIESVDQKPTIVRNLGAITKKQLIIFGAIFTVSLIVLLYCRNLTSGEQQSIGSVVHTLLTPSTFMTLQGIFVFVSIAFSPRPVRYYFGLLLIFTTAVALLTSHATITKSSGDEQAAPAVMNEEGLKGSVPAAPTDTD